nr:NADH dehydrogenase subunit 4 [Raillietina sp. HL-2022]
MFYVISISVFIGLFIGFCWLLLFSGGLLLEVSSNVLMNDIFIFDGLSFYTVLLVSVLGVYGIFCFFTLIGWKAMVFLFLSFLFSILCFCTNNVVLFWCFYELSMLPLVYLVFKESPYSERFLAGWYFCSYLLVTSLPLILILIYISVVQNSFLFSNWSMESSVSIFVYIILSFVFFSKVPLVPFHTWLPIVHAEATSIVSIFLSGYIMKLGLLGVYRSAWLIFESGVGVYLFVCLAFCIYFFVVAIMELDGKRWLAFLSLAHIVIPFLGFVILDSDNMMFMFLYCLGHGLGAGIVFSLLWWFYDTCNSRNWFLIKSSVNNNTTMMIVVSLSLLTLCSFPITINFFCEVNFVKVSSFSLLCVWFWFVYLFIGGLIPLVLCGHLLIRCEFIDSGVSSSFCFFGYLFYLCLWCYTGIMWL